MEDEIGLSVEVQTYEVHSTKPPAKADVQYACELCGKVFQDSGNCRKHYIRHGQNKGNECEICHHLFQGKQQKLQHMMFQHGDEKYEYKCEICNEIFGKLDDLHLHSRKQHDIGEQCNICWVKFSTTEEYHAHMDEHVKSKTAQKCDVCDKYYRDKYSLKIHMRNHTGERPFECPHCPEKFTARTYLFRHIDSKHMTETPYHCELCNVSFKTILQLRSHVKTKMHANDSKSAAVPVKKDYQCEFCPKTFSIQTYLTIHLRTHNDVKPYYCPICSKGFSQVGNMNQHLKRMHQPKGPKKKRNKFEQIECAECKQVFDAKRSYNYHIRQHRLQKLYKCSICSKEFTRLQKCNAHEATHNPDSNIKCDGCQKVFFSWSNLNRHYKACCSFKNQEREATNDEEMSDIIKQEVVDEIDLVESGQVELIDAVELNDTVSRIIKSEPVWQHEEAVQVTFMPTEEDFPTELLHPDETESMCLIEEKNSNATNKIKSSKQQVTFDDIIHETTIENKSSESTCLIDKNSNATDKPKPLEQQVTFDDIINETTNENKSPDLIESIHTSLSIANFSHAEDSTKSLFIPSEPSLRNCQSPIKLEISSNEDKTFALLGPSTLQQSTFVEIPDPNVSLAGIKAENENLSYVQEINPITNDSINKNSKVVILQIDDKVVEVQYHYPDSVAEEEVSTTGITTDQDISTQTIESVVDQSAEMIPVLNTDAHNYIEIQDLGRLDENNQIIFHSAYDVPKYYKKLESGNSYSNTSYEVPKYYKNLESGNTYSNTASLRSSEFACSICGKTFTEKSNLKNHEKRHGKDKGNECDVCRKLFQGRQQVFQHKMAEHNIKVGQLKCEICGEMTGSIEDLRNHGNTVHSSEYPFECSYCFKRYVDEESYEVHVAFHLRAFPCDICDKSYDTEKMLTNHYRSHTGDRPYQCQTCFKSFLLLSHLKCHELIHAAVKPFNCPVCDKGFIKKQRMEVHLQTHKHNKVLQTETKHKRKQIKMPNKTYSCNFCTKTFTQQTYLTMHMRTHTKDRPYSCPVCGKSFSQNGNMLTHWQIHNRTKATDWIKCDECEATFRSQAELNRHKNLKHVEYFQCKICQETFETNFRLQKHLASHKTTEMYRKCDLCEAVLKSKDSYRKHMVYHNTPSVNCQICNTSLASDLLLKKHLQDHHNPENKFECETCHRRYPEQSKLDSHMKTHQDKPFKCTVCDRSYQNDKSLRLHLNVHSNSNDLYQCKICGKKFNMKGSYTRHLKIHKTTEEEDTEDSSSTLSSKLSNTYSTKTGNIKIVISEDSFKCVDCQEVFQDHSEFLEHVKLHTSIEYKV